jgi:hypothetical protein
MSAQDAENPIYHLLPNAQPHDHNREFFMSSQFHFRLKMLTSNFTEKKTHNKSFTFNHLSQLFDSLLSLGFVAGGIACVTFYLWFRHD